MVDNATIWVDIDQLEYWDRNPNEGDIGKIMMSIKEFGYNDTCQYWNGVIKGGNHSVMALQQLRKLGWHPDKIKIPSKCLAVNGDGWQIAMIDTSEMNEVVSNAFGLALNGTQRAGHDDPTKLVALLQEISNSTELVLESTSFDADDIDQLLQDLGVAGDAPEPPKAQVDRAAELQEKWQVVRGDVWHVGNHRIMCGDSTCAEDVEKLMGGVKMQGVFTSPPYAMQRKDQYGGIPTDDYLEWWDGVQSCVKSTMREDGSFFVNIKPHCEDGERVLYVMDLVLAMRRHWGWRFIDEYCWRRPGMPGRAATRFKNQFEPVYWFTLNSDYKFRPAQVMHYSNDVPVALGVGAGNTNWALQQGSGQILKRNKTIQGMAYPGNMINTNQNESSLGHAAAFPAGLPEFFIKAYSDEGDVWYDPFLGSGTTIVACEQTGRIGYGMEISEAYVSVCLQRMSDMGLTPELLTT